MDLPLPSLHRKTRKQKKGVLLKEKFVDIEHVRGCSPVFTRLATFFSDTPKTKAITAPMKRRKGDLTKKQEEIRKPKDFLRESWKGTLRLQNWQEVSTTKWGNTGKHHK